MIRDKYGDDGLISFVDNVCNLAALGCINAHQMLACIHRYSNKYERRSAFNKYENWLNNQIYTHIITDEKGEKQRVECTRYIAHLEQHTDAEPIVTYTNKISQR